MYHYRKTRKVYTSYPKPESCDFCDMAKTPNQIMETSRHAWIVRNRVSYDVWELRDVTDHLMVVPKRHVRSLEELNDAEKLDIMNVMARHEANDYNVYARSVHSVSRSVGHQHTHLIKTGHKRGHGMLMLRKPYFFIKF